MIDDKQAEEFSEQVIKEYNLLVESTDHIMENLSRDRMRPFLVAIGLMYWAMATNNLEEDEDIDRLHTIVKSLTKLIPGDRRQWPTGKNRS